MAPRIENIEPTIQTRQVEFIDQYEIDFKRHLDFYGPFEISRTVIHCACCPDILTSNNEIIKQDHKITIVERFGAFVEEYNMPRDMPFGSLMDFIRSDKKLFFETFRLLLNNSQLLAACHREQVQKYYSYPGPIPNKHLSLPDLFEGETLTAFKDLVDFIGASLF